VPYLSVVSANGRNAFASSQTGANLNTRLTVQGTATAATLNATPGDGQRRFTWSGENLIYAPAASPQAEDLPFEAQVQMGFEAAALRDSDGICHGSETNCAGYNFSFAGSEVRLGRLLMGNAHGSELQSLRLPLQVQSWQSVAGQNLFAVNTTDTCSNALLQNVDLGPYSGNLAGRTTPSISWSSSSLGTLVLSAPGSGNQGSVLARLRNTPAWLWFNWSGNGREAASGLATFGIHAGSPPLIYRRELYRTQ
jgi:MSHA biogenesis protein MshQ